MLVQERAISEQMMRLFDLKCRIQSLSITSKETHYQIAWDFSEFESYSYQVAYNQAWLLSCICLEICSDVDDDCVIV